MARDLVTNLVTFDHLLREKDKYNMILNKNILDYIEALLNLEVSALHKNNIEEKAELALADLQFFKDLIYYNIFYMTQNLVDPNNQKTEVYRKFKGMSIYVKANKQYNRSTYLFNMEQDENDLPTATMYNPDLKDVDERLQELHDSIITSETEYNNISNTNADTITSYSLKKKIEYLKSLTKEDIEKEYKEELYRVHEQRSFLRSMMESCSLDMNKDFINEDSLLVRQTPSTKILIIK